MSELSKIKGNINLIRPFLDFKKKELSYISKKSLGRYLKILVIKIKIF